jgi:chemotaxis protein methyltransferase CheR
MEQISDVRRKRYFLRGAGPRRGQWRIGDALRSAVAFRALNLFDAWPMRGQFDVIFCRNVIIYFDDTNKRRLVARFADALAPGGYLVLGHSESLLNEVRGLEPCGRTAYRKATS